MGSNKNYEINKVVSFLKEETIKAISEIEEVQNKKEPMKDFEELWQQVSGALCEQLEKLPVVDLTEDCGEIIERDGKLHADIYIRSCENNIIKNSDFWPKLIEFILNDFVMYESHYIGFSCFDSEEDIIEELKENFKIFELKNDSWCNQVWLKGKFNDKIRKLILENYLTNEGRIKWFVIILTSDHKKSKSLSMAHYGTELYIDGLFKEDVNTVEEIFSSNKASIRWSED